MDDEKILFDEATVRRTLARLAHEIIESQTDPARPLALVGVRRRGVPLAEMLKSNIERFSELRPELGILDITLYRDDLSERYAEPQVNGTVIPFDVTGHNIILVDDVLYTGRTARAAMEALIALGRPASIRLCVMVDRGHRELPISANFVGKNVPTSREEFISVHVPDFDGKTEVTLSRRAAE